MRVVMPDAPAHLLEWRKTTGADRWDEMWEGVLHMPPMPNREHQHFQWALATWLWHAWATPRGNKVYGPVNLASVGGWRSNYRIPDLIRLTPERFSIDHNEYSEGAPTAVVEIRSPDDETYEKLPFYAQLGVPEVWIIDRDANLHNVDLGIRMVRCQITELRAQDLTFSRPFAVCDSTLAARFWCNYFLQGFRLENCTVTSELDFQCGGHNASDYPFVLDHCVFKEFVNFFDCWFTGPVCVRACSFEKGTNLLGNTGRPYQVTFDVPPVIEHNQGRLDLDGG